MRVAIYARVSLEERRRKDGRLVAGQPEQNPENQLFELRAYCAQQSGWIVIREYVDRMTGGTSERPEFQRLFADAAAKKFDLVLFWALDRFTREGIGPTLTKLATLKECGVQWRSMQERHFDSAGPFQELLLALMAFQAKMEKIRISERTIAGLERARRNGKKLGPNFRIEHKPWELRALQQQGLSLRAIAKQKGMSLTSVVRILKSDQKAKGATA